MSVRAVDVRAGHSFLEAAADVGLSIVAQAVWHDGRCNWIGAEPQERPGGGFSMVMTYHALDGDLYGGTSGIALFLAELYAVTGDARTRETALGAIRHAIARVPASAQPVRLSLFSGGLGVALAAARLATLLDADDLFDEAARVVKACIPAADDADLDFDLLLGVAGAIAGLVVLDELLDEPDLLELASRLGDRLTATAVRSEDGASWSAAPKSRQRNLTGLSHGAAGVACALLELDDALGGDRFRALAEDAFAYERACFVPEAGNWPDFRDLPGRPPPESGSEMFMTFWCHGAAGIALSRLRAHELLNDDRLRAEAVVAAETTARELEADLAAAGGNFSLCHGIAGNAEILLEAAGALGREGAKHATLALEAALRGIEQFGRDRHPWPCGAAGGETPNLFLGLAGIGYFYLRLRDPSIPSLLLPRREQFRA